VPNVTLGDWVSLMLLVNSHKFKMAAASTPGREYNRRAAIIKDHRAGRLLTEIIRFFGYPRSIVYDVVAKYSASEQSNESSSTPARKSHSKECTVRISAMVERIQALISEDPQLMRKLVSIVGVSELTMRRIVEEDLRYKSYTLKIWQIFSEAGPSELLAVKEFWPPNSPDLNPLDYYVWSVVERVTNKSRHPNVTS